MKREHYEEMLKKPAIAKANGLRIESATAGIPAVGDKLEADLHQKIIEHCNAQFPRWKFRHARMDIETTEEVGVEDFTIFMPEGKTLHIECKSATGKVSTDQRNWAHEMDRLGHTVYVVRSLAEFQSLLKI